MNIQFKNGHCVQSKAVTLNPKIGGIVMKITAKTKVGEGDEKREVENSVDWHDVTNVAQLIDICGGGDVGEGVVLSNAMAQITVTIQSKIRAAVKAGLDPQEVVSAYVPGVKAARNARSTEDKAVALYATMTDEQREDFIQKLKEMSAEG